SRRHCRRARSRAARSGPPGGARAGRARSRQTVHVARDRVRHAFGARGRSHAAPSGVNLPRRGRLAIGYGLLAALAYVPPLLTAPDKVAADTKQYLYLDPARLLARAPSMWDPNVAMGTVTHQ